MQGGISRDAPRFYVELALDPGIKNAGGHPPALGGPSIRGYRYLYTRSCAPGLRETFRPNLSKVILSEITVVSKKDLLGI